MSRKLFAILLGCALLAPSAASAWFAECTPGFWKNHPEEWSYDGVLIDLPRCGTQAQFITCCAEQNPYGDFENLLEALIPPQGNAGCGTTGTDCARHVAATFLNRCFNVDVYNPCPD